MTGWPSTAQFALGLFIVVDLLGIVGAVMVAVPFLREQRLRRIVHYADQGDPIAGMEDVDGPARATARHFSL